MLQRKVVNVHFSSLFLAFNNEVIFEGQKKKLGQDFPSFRFGHSSWPSRTLHQGFQALLHLIDFQLIKQALNIFFSISKCVEIYYLRMLKSTIEFCNFCCLMILLIFLSCLNSNLQPL